jgi:hypothetical protein
MVSGFFPSFCCDALWGIYSDACNLTLPYFPSYQNFNLHCCLIIAAPKKLQSERAFVHHNFFVQELVPDFRRKQFCLKRGASHVLQMYVTAGRVLMANWRAHATPSKSHQLPRSCLSYPKLLPFNSYMLVTYAMHVHKASYRKEDKQNWTCNWPAKKGLCRY